jgi:anti-anti-sigma factor
VADLDENASLEPQFCVHVDDAAGANGDVVVRLSGDLDIAGADEARAVVDQALGQPRSRLTFDLTDLRFMDSSGIAVLVAATQKVDTVTLRNPSPVIRRLLTIAGLVDIFVLTP